MASNCSIDGTALNITTTVLQAFMFFLGFTSVAGVLGNILVIWCIITTKKLQTVTNYFVLNLSVADVSVSAIFGPVSIFFWTNGCQKAYEMTSLCTAMGALIVGLCTVSIVSLAWISFNRYLLIVHGSAKYRKLFNRRHIPLMILCSWLWAGIVLIPPFFGFGGVGYNSAKGWCDFNTSLPYAFHYQMYCLFIAIGIPLMVTFTSYVQIFLTVHKSNRRVAQHVSTGNGQERRRKKDLKLTKDLFIIFGIFCLCAMPYTLAEVIDHKYELIPIEFHIFGSVLIVSNSTWNPFVYAWRNRDFRFAMRRVLSLQIFDHNSELLQDVSVTT